MVTFALVPGAGGQGWYWHRLVPELESRGHDAIAVDLPSGDESAGVDEYVDAVVEAIGGRSGVVLVAQSLAGITAPIVCTRVPVDLLVLVNAMIPSPGETAGAWWANTEHAAAREAQAARDGRSIDDDPEMLDAFFHDVPPDVVAEAMARGPIQQTTTIFIKPWPLERWPDVPTRALLCADDRFFPLEFQRRLVAERLGIVPDEMPGGHLVALSRPAELADRLVSYLG